MNMGGFEAAFGKWVVKYRWLIIITTILIVGFITSGVRFITFTNDMRVFFGKENPQLKALEALENTFNKNENVFFTIAPKDGNVFTRQTLAAIEELTLQAWQMPYSSRVDSISNFQHTWADQDDLIVEDLYEDAQNLSDEEIKRIKKIALSEPLLVNNVISPSGHVTGISVTILKPGKSMDEVSEADAFARELIEDIKKKYPGIEIYLTGGVIYDSALGELSKNDMLTLMPAMFVVLLLIIGFSLRSFVGTFSTFIIIAISMVTGMGLAGWLRIQLTPASANSPVIILTLAVADSIHILATVFYLLRSGKTKYEAISESMRINLVPVFLTSATTAIGFLTMNFSDAPPFRDLGNIVAMGVMAAFLYSIFFLPALVAVLPVRLKSKTENTCKPCDKLANFIVKRNKFIFWSVLVVIFVLLLGILRIDLNDDWIKYFDQRYDVRRATDFTEKHLTGFHLIEYSLESGEPGGINNSDYLATVEEFSNWYRKQPKVVHVSTITDIMKRLNKNMNGDNESYYRLPEERDLAAQYLLLYEMSLPFGLDLNNQINVDKSSSRMVVLLRDITTKDLRQMDTNARAWLKANAPKGMFTYGSGLSIIWAHISERNINSMLGASILALFLISCILIFALRSLKLGLISLIPNLAPAFMAFGTWGFLVGQVGLGLSVVISLTLGIVVDDTVHFLSKYMRARREHNMNSSDAVRYSFHTVGTAMWITSLALVLGFTVLAFSGFKMNADMSIMTAITIAFALAMDFFFLPTLLIKLEG